MLVLGPGEGGEAVVSAPGIEEGDGLRESRRRPPRIRVIGDQADKLAPISGRGERG